jgi:hypothetical protein
MHSNPQIDFDATTSSPANSYVAIHANATTVSTAMATGHDRRHVYRKGCATRPLEARRCSNSKTYPRAISTKVLTPSTTSRDYKTTMSNSKTTTGKRLSAFDQRQITGASVENPSGNRFNASQPGFQERCIAETTNTTTTKSNTVTK